MTTDQKATCGNCEYFSLWFTDDNENGECRYNRPSVTGEPRCLVHATDTRECIHHKPKEARDER